ncbi:MAG: hypothetical protein QM726_14475 [Chitinophagaceae bacterium]
MKLWIMFICVFVTIISGHRDNNEHITCERELKKYSCKSFQVIKFCQKVLDDSTNYKYDRLIGNGKLMEIENFDKLVLKYRNVTDRIISFDVLYMGPQQNKYRIDLMQLDGDTLKFRVDLAGKYEVKFARCFHRVEFMIKFAKPTKDIKVFEIKKRPNMKLFKRTSSTIIG